MTTTQQTAIEKHGRKLLAIFPNATERDPVKLCKRLRRLEAKAHKAAIDLCNIPDFQARFDVIFQDVQIQVSELLQCYELSDPRSKRKATPNVFVNSDPRGYALKISSEYVKAFELDIPRDMGGYGILAPEIDKDGN